MKKLAQSILLISLCGLFYTSCQTQTDTMQPIAVVSPTKMNVLYIGPDNPLAVAVSGIPNDKIKVSISGADGSIEGSNGKYIARVSKTGKAQVIVSVEESQGNYKIIDSIEFRVMAIPRPVAYFAGKSGSATITKEELLNGKKVEAKMENFAFDLQFEVDSFDLSMTISVANGGVMVTKSAKSNEITPQMRKYLNKAEKIYIEKIWAKGPEGRTIKLEPIILKVI